MASVLTSISDWTIYSAGWVPTRVTHQNLTHIVKNCQVMVTFSDQEFQSVSFSSSAQAIIGPLHVIHITGGDLNTCLGHIHAFLNHVIKTSPLDSGRTIILTVHFSRNIDIAAIRHNLSQYFGDNLRISGDRTDGILVLRSYTGCLQ